MSAEESLRLQDQVRENSDELQMFLKDLEGWEKDMKKKENELKLVQVTDDQEIPPIRNSLCRSKKKNRHKKNKDKAAAKERISSYNYKAWEKFDVESELQRLDEDKKESSAAESSENEEKLNTLQNQQLAIIKKDKGNEFFKNCQYDSAINCYTLGIELDPENALLPANRAMAFLKKEQFQAAENDCTLCLSLDSTYVKAYLRRGTARKALQKYDLARRDFSKALELEPDNKQAQLELHDLDKISSVLTYDLDANIDDTECQEAYMPDDLMMNCKADSSPTKEAKTLAELASVAEAESIKSRPKSTNKKLSFEDLHNEIGDVISTLEQTLPPIPTASYQFLTDWKKLIKYPHLAYQYLKQFPPEKFPVLFKHYMEPELFPGILHTLSTSFTEKGDDVFLYLKHLKSVGRFETMLMFMSDQEKKDLKTLADYMKKSNVPEAEALLRCYNYEDLNSL